MINRVYKSANFKYGIYKPREVEHQLKKLVRLIYKPREVEHPIKKRVRLRKSLFSGCSTSRGIEIPYLKWVDLINCILREF